MATSQRPLNADERVLFSTLSVVSRGRSKTTGWPRLNYHRMSTNERYSQQCLWFHEVDQRQPDGHVSKTAECRQTSDILDSFREVSRTFLRCKSLSASDDSRLQAVICKPPTAIRLIELRCGIFCAKRRQTRSAFTNKSTRMGRQLKTDVICGSTGIELEV